MVPSEEQKIIELENDSVSELLGGLKRVGAPGDFDFRVKARIARGRPVEKSRSWLPASVRLAVPLVLLLAVGGYFGLDAIYSPVDLAVAPVVETQPGNFTPKIAASSDILPALPIKNQSSEREPNKAPETVAKTDFAPKERRVVLTKPAAGKRGGGSTDMALGIGQTIGVKGVKETLLSVGIDASYSTQSWKIGSVKQSSKAALSGLKSGDVIEVIDGQNLTEKTTFGNKFSGKSIRILRDGKSMQIDMKP